MTGPGAAGRHPGWALAWGGTIGILGGLIGLGGAEFRLPVLLAFFRLSLKSAVAVNLVVSLITLVSALFFRTRLGTLEPLASGAPVALNLLAGSLLGAYLGPLVVSRLPERAFTVVISACLIGVSGLLIGHDLLFDLGAVALAVPVRVAAGLTAGVAIGLFSSVLGVAGGELIIPTLVLLYGIDIKVAGSLSVVISIPTICVALLRYRSLLRPGGMAHYARLVAGFGIGSMAGAFAGSLLLPLISGSLVSTFLGIILLISAVRLVTARTTCR